MPESRLVKHIHKYSLDRGKSWESKSRKLFSGLGIDDLLLIDNPSKAACIRKAKEKLSEVDKEKWYNCLMSNVKDANNGNKLRTYRLNKSTFQTET